MKKSTSITALLTALAALSAMPVTAGAAMSNTGDYVQSIYLDKYALTAEEAASGEATVHTSVYLKGTTNSRMEFLGGTCQILADETAYTYMRNQYDPMIAYDEATYSYLNGEFTTKYRPFCFGQVSGGSYSSAAFISQIRDYCADPVSGNTIYYNGDNTVRFKMPGRLYVNEEGELAPDNVSHQIVCPLTINEDGSASYSFLYADIYSDHTEVDMATGTIPYYQPELLEVDGKIPDINNLISFAYNPLTPTHFLGNSDDFPLLETDLCFKKDTPCGIYNIVSNQEYCNMAAVESGTSCNLPLAYRDAAVAVGVGGAVLAESQIPDMAMYYSHDNKMITAASMGATLTADVSYTDGTSQSGIDITGTVNARTAPNKLWSEIASVYIDDIRLFCGTTPIIADGSELTQTVVVGKKGDASLDGTVGIDDATAVLRYYAQNAAGLEAKLTSFDNEQDERIAFFLADIDTQSQTLSEGGSIDLGDASSILKYYASIAAGMIVSWDEFIK